MTTPYIPPRDTDLSAWSANFAALITAAPALYGLLPADAVIIAATDNTWQADLAIALAPVTRTEPAIAAKNSSKLAGVDTWRVYAQQIRANPGVTNADKLALGLNLPNNSPSPIPAPPTNPLLSFLGATPFQHTLRYADSTTPASRAKPAGAIQLQLYAQVAPTAGTDPNAASLVGVHTANPVAVNFSAPDVGKLATYWARWITQTGLVGPWSPSFSIGIIGG